MAKICFPHYSQGEFDSLKEAILTLSKNGYWSYFLRDIVQYNICYRDHLRQFGIDSLVDRLTEEVPELKDNKDALDSLYKWWKRAGLLADYDIQCHNIADTVSILGHTFNGLKDIISHCGISGRIQPSVLGYFVNEKNSEESDIYVGEIYESYPIFDSYDVGDNRTYQNYIFRPHPITENDMGEASQNFYESNFCMVHEYIPHKQLPLLYYKGDGNYMLLATSKQK